MTKEELLETLKQGIKDKKIVRDRKDNLYIRFQFVNDLPRFLPNGEKYIYDYCPLLTAYRLKTGQSLYNTDWKKAAIKLEMSTELAAEIIEAADGFNDPLREELREIK